MTNKIFIVLKHELLQKLRSKSYIILTLAGPFLLVLIFALPVLFQAAGSGGPKHIAIVDETGKLFGPISRAASGGSGPGFGKSEVIFDETHLGSTSAPVVDSLMKRVTDKELQGYLVIPPSVLSLDSASRMKAVASLHLANSNDFSTIGVVRGAYEDAVANERLKAGGFDPQVYENARKSTSIETFKVDQSAESKSSGATFVVGYVIGFFLYMSMVLYGVTIMRSVIEEKTSRVMEVVVSSIDAFDLLVGKVLGVGLAGLIQMTVWAIIMALAATVGIAKLSSVADLGQIGPQIPISVFIYFIAFFVFGYLLFATLYAGVGATAEQESDVQQVSLPITFLLIIPFVSLSSVLQSPSSTSSVVLSLIPFFSPILMMARILSETPPVWQIALSFALMTATFFAVLWVAARVYRVGILMYGKRFTLPEIVRWIRYS